MEDTVESVTRNISGISGPAITNSESLQELLLKFGEDSKRLRTSVETFVDWIANGSPPWADYYEFISRHLIALNKQPGVHTVVVGETWRRLFAKIVIKVAVSEATMVCQVDHLCAVLKAVINSAVHGVHDTQDENSNTEAWERVQQDQSDKNAVDIPSFMSMIRP